MATLSQQAYSLPSLVATVLVETAEELNASTWTARPEIVVTTATLPANGQDLGSAEFHRRYGMLKWPWESALSTKSPLNLLNHWVRLRFFTEQGDSVQWLGLITNANREPFGGDIDPTGIQTWVAYGPLLLLRKSTLTQSYWEPAIQTSAEEALGTVPAAQVIDWFPPVNTENKDPSYRGTRSSELYDMQLSDGVSKAIYLFSSGSTAQPWTYKQLVEHLLWIYGGSSWRLSGHTDAIDVMTGAVEFPEGTTVADALRQLINPRLGVDFVAQGYSETTVDDSGDEAVEQGFEIRVFSLLADASSMSGIVVPANTRQIDIHLDDETDVASAQLVETYDQTFDRVRVWGNRTVICTTLLARVPSTGGPVTLVPSWTDEDEAAYKAGSEDQRRAGHWPHVYQTFTAPEDWDYWEGYANPIIGEDGTITGYGADRQNVHRGTLDWTPLLSGFDYTTDPPTRTNDSATPDRLPPQVYLYLVADEDDDGVGDGEGKYVTSETAEVQISNLQNDLGIHITSTPQHYLGYGHFDPTEDELGETEEFPWINYQSLAATIAFESDHRAYVSQSRADNLLDTTDGEVLTIDIFVDAELWYLAPTTVVGVDDDGVVSYSPSDPVLIRDDTDALRQAAALAVNRYLKPRYRGEIVFRGLLPMSGYVGAMVSAVTTGDEQYSVSAPITQVAWSFGDQPSTMISAGYGT